MARTQGRTEWAESLFKQLQRARETLDSADQILAIPHVTAGPAAAEWRAWVNSVPSEALEATTGLDDAIFGAAIEATGRKDRVLELLQQRVERLATRKVGFGRADCSEV